METDECWDKCVKYGIKFYLVSVEWIWSKAGCKAWIPVFLSMWKSGRVNRIDAETEEKSNRKTIERKE